MGINTNNHYDVIVSGVGSMGAAACYYLAQKNIKVLGIDQFDIPHEQGSHAGQSRIIRKAYFENADYIPLLKRAYENWKRLESQSGAKIYYQTGLLYHGKPDHPIISGTKDSAALYDIELDPLDARETKSRFPQFRIPNDFISFIEPDAGFVTAERSVLTYKSESLKMGATIKTNEKVIEWKKGPDGFKLTTDKDIYFCRKLIITAGAWAGKLIPELKADLRVTRQTLAWIKPKDESSFTLGNFPCWLVAPNDKGGIYYGFPILPLSEFGGPDGLKIAHHYPHATADPDNVDRNITAHDEEEIRGILRDYFTMTDIEIAGWKTCLYTNTRDEDFIIDFLPGYDKDVAIACGFSGHGFKFVSVVGEILADLAAEGKTDMPIDFLRLDRDRLK